MGALIEPKDGGEETSPESALTEGRSYKRFRPLGAQLTYCAIVLDQRPTASDPWCLDAIIHCAAAFVSPLHAAYPTARPTLQIIAARDDAGGYN
jgi:hypothetical protein